MRAVKRVFTPGFWCAGFVVLGALSAMVAGQTKAWVEHVDEATSQAREVVRAQLPAEAWALEKWERCRVGQGEYAAARVILLADCDQSVVAAAAERGEADRVAAVHALSAQRRAAELASRKIEPAWPLSAMKPAVNRVALLLMGA